MTDVGTLAILALGGLTSVVLTILVRVLFKLSDRLEATASDVRIVDTVVQDLRVDKIPTIRILIDKVETRTTSLEKRADRIEQAIHFQHKD